MDRRSSPSGQEGDLRSRSRQRHPVHLPRPAGSISEVPGVTSAGRRRPRTDAQSSRYYAEGELAPAGCRGNYDPSVHQAPHIVQYHPSSWSTASGEAQRGLARLRQVGQRRKPIWSIVVASSSDSRRAVAWVSPMGCLAVGSGVMGVVPFSFRLVRRGRFTDALGRHSRAAG